MLALGLRFYQLDAQSFWNDEGNSARLSERSVALIVEGTASDIHPPLYYLLLRGWRELLGDSEFGLRSFSSFVGVLTVAGVMAIGLALWRKKWQVAVLAAGLTAVNPALVYYSQETRMYTLLAFWGVLSTWLFVQLSVNSKQLSANSRRLLSVSYVVVLVAGLYTHYFFPTVIVVHNVLFAVYLWGQWQKVELKPLLKTAVLPWATMMFTAALLYLPWLPVYFRQSGGFLEPEVSLGNFMMQGVNWLLLGETLASVPWLTGLLIILLLWSLLTNDRYALAAAFATLFMLLFMYLAGTTRPAFFKFLVTAVPFFALWLAAGSASNRLGRWGTGLFLLGVGVIVVVGNGRSLQNLYTNPDFARADYRSMVQRIVVENHPSAGIILNAPNQWEVFTYYYKGEAPIYPLPRGFPKRDEIEAELADIASSHDRIYTIFWGEAQRDPERIVESWLDANAFKATDKWVRDVRFVTYAVPSEPAAEMETAVHVQFGEPITLQGYTLSQATLRPGDIVEVTLFWETAVSLEQRYKVFLHILDENGQLVAQRDSEPGGGLVPTNIWEPTTPVRDNHGILLPATLPPGTYQLTLGLYDLADPAVRLPIQSADAPNNALLLTTITIQE
ncbi:MAG: glycosyltransferase family 39 protein [Chloroflexota bacterium]